MTTDQIKEFADFKMRVDVTLTLDEEIRLRRLWLAACAVSALERIATKLEEEQITQKLAIIGERLPG